MNGEQEKKLHYSCEGRLEKCVPRDHCLSSLGNSDPQDGFFYPSPTVMIDSYNL